MTDLIKIPSVRKFDLICLGRIGVDLYANQIGCELENATSFSKYLGGSSANIAFGVARLGLKSALISRVGKEQMGNFLIATLEKEGCETKMIQIDDSRLTGLVLLGIKDRDCFPLLFYRENCADMALDINQINEADLAATRSLLITGTHFSTPLVRLASLKALEFAQKHGVFKVLDIDYRPVLWGLTTKGEGANRYVPNLEVTLKIQEILVHFDLLIGTEEEFIIAGGIPSDLIGSLKVVRQCSQAILVVKLGALGCVIYVDEIPNSINNEDCVLGDKVPIFNVLGAGDAFAAGLMSGILSGQTIIDSAKIANACGALVVSRHACAPAMPTKEELIYWQENKAHINPTTDAMLNHLHRVTVKRKEWQHLFVLAFDHRRQLFDLAAKYGVEESKISDIKNLLLTASLQIENKLQLKGQMGVLIDGYYGHQELAQVTGSSLWIGRPVELPSSRPLKFDQSLSIASDLISWPINHTVKCLVFYHPDDKASLRINQEQQLLALWQATRYSGHELLLELITPNLAVNELADEFIFRSVKRLYNLGIMPEWWKLPPLMSTTWDKLADLINERDPYCRGITILGLNNPITELIKAFKQANNPIVKGFMVGRSLWEHACEQWLPNKINDQQFIDQVAVNFEQLLTAWKQIKAENR